MGPQLVPGLEHWLIRSASYMPYCACALGLGCCRQQKVRSDLCFAVVNENLLT